MKLLILFIFTLVPFIKADACSCAGFTNALHAAQGEDVNVAKVITLKNQNRAGVATVKIQQMFKGQITDMTFEVQGQDGANCNGPVLSGEDSWIMLYTKTKTGYETLSCAESALSIDPKTRKVSIHLGDVFQLSEVEFQNLVDFKVQPTVKGLSCQMMAERYPVDFDEEVSKKHEIDFSKDVTSTAKERFTLTASEDLSSLGRDLSTFQIYAFASKINSTTYLVDSNLTDPFFGVTASSMGMADLKKSYGFTMPVITKNTDVNGKPAKEGKPFLSHTVHSRCQFVVGAPLVPVK